MWNLSFKQYFKFKSISDKYYEVIGIDPGGIGDESRIMDEEVVEEGIMRTAAANGGSAHRIQLVKRNKENVVIFGSSVGVSLLRPGVGSAGSAWVPASWGR